MSDERDSADGAEDTSRTGQTAVVTPQRPSGKRSRQRALASTHMDDDDTELTDSGDVTEGAAKSTKTPKAKTKKGAKGGGDLLAPFKYVWNFIAQVIAELRKVIWPNRKQMISYTCVVLVFLAFMVTLIGLVDVGLAKLVLLVFG